MQYNLIIAFVTFFISVIITFFGIKIFKKLKIGQPILSYVKEHKDKSGTPTMGGVFFIVSTFLSFLIFAKLKTLSIGILTTFLSFFIVGFLDDFLKIKTKNNLGLKPYQKIIFQVVLSFFIAVFAYQKGVNSIKIPFIEKKLELGVFVIFLYVFIVIALTNAVNLTDGLDGLASSVTFIYLLFFTIILYLQRNAGIWLVKEEEFNSIIALNVCLMASLLAFLVFNGNKAKIFMGDSGSLALGGYLSALSILTGNVIYILFLGICYIISVVSVIFQVLYYKKTKKRVFLMAPYHHHLQKKGLTESKICYLYSMITGIMGGLILISYL